MGERSVCGNGQPSQNSNDFPNKMAAITYPEARRSEFTEVYHAEVVPDHYNWLHDPESEETKQFVAAQNAISEPYLATPERDQFKERYVANPLLGRILCVTYVTLPCACYVA
jgi:hypothetical protein